MGKRGEYEVAVEGKGRKSGSFKKPGEAAKALRGVEGAYLVRNRRHIIAFWCSYRKCVAVTKSALPWEKEAIESWVGVAPAL